MKREEKNEISLARIINGALKEFAEKGYSGASINVICSQENLSKGILYHYFTAKDELYLACVSKCFSDLTEFLKRNIFIENNDVKKQLENYFMVRFKFFQKYPLYQRIFTDSIIHYPKHLENEIFKIMSEFNNLNIFLLNKILTPLKLRSDITKEEVIETFKEYQDYVNIHFKMNGSEDEVAYHEKKCLRALYTLLYGVVEREGAVKWVQIL